MFLPHMLPSMHTDLQSTSSEVNSCLPLLTTIYHCTMLPVFQIVASLITYSIIWLFSGGYTGHCILVVSMETHSRQAPGHSTLHLPCTLWRRHHTECVYCCRCRLQWSSHYDQWRWLSHQLDCWALHNSLWKDGMKSEVESCTQLYTELCI